MKGQTESESDRQSPARKVSAVLSAVLWTVGFFLAFVIPKTSPIIWVPDFLLLVGFFPLLFVWKPSWPWLVFGCCNLFIGFVLEVSKFLPDDSLPPEMRLVRAHLVEYHAPMAWMFVGVVALIYGAIRFVKGCLRWFRNRSSGRKAQAK